ncbi:MAG: response regulator transcription factor [Clostridia bacterium]|nr:response regulator transcription factor [Clostridia bacterium]
MQEKKILCIDPNQNILDLLTFNLEASGYIVETNTTGQGALSTDASLILLDPQLPDISGWDLLSSIEKTPIVILSENADEDAIVQAFELGCVDYIVKPFSVRELLARVKAVLRRFDNYPVDELIRVGSITIDSENYEAYRNNEKLQLTLKEYELLKLLAETPGRVLTRDFLLDRIWGYEFYGETRTVDVHIRHIRMKLGDDAGMIETVRGVGYRMTASA